MSADELDESEEETRAIKQSQDERAEEEADGEEPVDEENLDEENE